jgi:hypothetical protein
MRTALILARRFLTLAALMVWQGGFIFYTAFVVPIGTEFLGTAARQGFITRQVTNDINRCGVAALALMVWDLAAETDPRRLRRIVRVALFTLMVAASVALFDVHQRLESLLDVPNERVLDRQQFRALHRIYLWVSSVQWGGAVLYLLLTVAAWRCADSVQKRVQ